MCGRIVLAALIVAGFGCTDHQTHPGDDQPDGKADLWDGFAASWQIANTLHDGEVVALSHPGGVGGPRYRALQLRVRAGDSVALTVPDLRITPFAMLFMPSTPMPCFTSSGSTRRSKLR